MHRFPQLRLSVVNVAITEMIYTHGDLRRTIEFDQRHCQLMTAY